MSETVSRRARLRSDWLALPTAVRVSIVVGSVVVAALCLWALGLYVAPSSVPSDVAFVADVAYGRLSLSTPAVMSRYMDILLGLIAILAVTLADGLINVVVCVLASIRKDYPRGQDKTTWVAGLWAVFLIIQLPTGIPSALAYWGFIARPARSEARRAATAQR